MFAIGPVELMLLVAVIVVVPLVVLYLVIRYAVRGGVADAQRTLETERVRDRQGLDQR